MRIHISGVTKCVTKFLTLSKSPHCDSVRNFVTHFVTAEIWTLNSKHAQCKSNQKRSIFNRIFPEKEFIIKSALIIGSSIEERNASIIDASTLLKGLYVCFMPD